ncbi:hypothetical protein ACFFGV_13885 [Pontibacillus salicampi]|uniref:DUF1002 domain-containing protein n=1 Tax=Pontibacillus salicampi TaxID=1449801 RepID=A0ABV6LQH3_9BACI
MMYQTRKVIAMIVAMVMLTLPVSSAVSHVNAAELNDSLENQNQTTYTKNEVEQLLPLLEAIEEIPDDMLARGDAEEINNYFAEKGIETNVVKNARNVTAQDAIIAGSTSSKGYGTQGVWGCSLAIAEIIALNALPIAKITKIKKYIDALGGIKETAKLLVGATTVGEKTAAFSALVAELSGFTKVRNKCGF